MKLSKQIILKKCVCELSNLRSLGCFSLINTHSHCVLPLPTQQQGASNLQARKPPPLSVCAILVQFRNFASSKILSLFISDGVLIHFYGMIFDRII